MPKMDDQLQKLDEKNIEVGQKFESNELEPLKSNATYDTEQKKILTITERFKRIKENITIEPIMACYIMPSVLASFAVQNLNLEKACRVNLNYSAEVCHALYLRQTQNYTHFEDEVQKLTASVQAWKNVIQTAIPVFFILFVGAWSDKTGRRKPCILLPILGELMASLGFIVNTYYFYQLPLEVTALTEGIIPAITGGWFVNLIGCYSYIGDITSEQDRTYRVGIVTLCMSVGLPLGTALGGVLLPIVGYYGVFTITSSLYLFSLIYGFFYLQDSKKGTLEKEKPKSCIGHLLEFFDVRLVADTFKVVFGKGAVNKRHRVCLLLLVVFILYGPLQGEYTVLYLFTRYRFNWDEVQYSMWESYAMVISLLGSVFSISLFTNYLKTDDKILCIIASTSKVAANFLYGFARNNLEIYLAPLLEILTGSLSIALRSIASKLVRGEEIGKVNSLFGLAEAMTPLVYGPLYSRVYMGTLNVLPGAFFLLGNMLSVPAIAIIGWLFYEERKERKKCNDVKDKDTQK